MRVFRWLCGLYEGGAPGAPTLQEDGLLKESPLHQIHVATRKELQYVHTRLARYDHHHSEATIMIRSLFGVHML